jgi:hypothetical protein
LQGAENIVLSSDGALAFVAGLFSDSLVVLNVADASSPSMVGLYAPKDGTFDSPDGVAVSLRLQPSKRH